MREQDRGKIKTPFMLAFSVGAVLFSAHAGGGKAIDTCKVLAHSTNRPFFTFPTIASTCASCTSLGIVYHPDGSLREYSFSKIPPNHIFINTQIITEAPDIYLWAGFTVLPSTEENGHLHGEVVSYGILVMLTIDKQYAERDILYKFSRSIGLPTRLADIHAKAEDLAKVTAKALAGIDVRVYPYTVTEQMIVDGIMEMEAYDEKIR